MGFVLECTAHLKILDKLVLQSRNLNDLQKRVEVGGISRGNVRGIGNITVQIKKSGQQTYLNEDKESLVVASANIEGIHGPPLYFRGVAKQLQNLFKFIKYRCG